MKKYTARIQADSEWEVNLWADTAQDAKKRLTDGDWDETTDMELIAPTRIVYVSETAENKMLDKNEADE